MNEDTSDAGDLSAERNARAYAGAQLTLIERRLDAPLNEERRARLLERLLEPRAGWTAEESARVPDGTEPGTIFRPLMRTTRHEGPSHE